MKESDRLDQELLDLIEDYDIPGDLVEFAIGIVRGIYAIPKMPTTRERLRELKRLRKADPDDKDLWAEEFNLLAGKQKVMFHLETREITVEQNDAHRKNSVVTKQRQNAAICYLADIWEQHTEFSVASYDRDEGLSFVVCVLRASGDSDVPNTDALRRRLDRLRS